MSVARVRKQIARERDLVGDLFNSGLFGGEDLDARPSSPKEAAQKKGAAPAKAAPWLMD
jgi:hypothetical protein